MRLSLIDGHVRTQGSSRVTKAQGGQSAPGRVNWYFAGRERVFFSHGQRISRLGHVRTLHRLHPPDLAKSAIGISKLGKGGTDVSS
jgi:hypothetical protein